MKALTFKNITCISPIKHFSLELEIIVELCKVFSVYSNGCGYGSYLISNKKREICPRADLKMKTVGGFPLQNGAKHYNHFLNANKTIVKL